MHTRPDNLNRRFANLREDQIKNILPEHFAAAYPKFIALLKRYYEFENENDSTELINHLFETRDISATDITLLSYIEDELLLGEAYFKGFGENETQLRAAANFSNILFRAKGTRFAIEWFFRSFFGEDVEVLYPKSNIFNVSDADGGSFLGADSLKYITDDKLYQTFALLIRVGIPINKWREIFKLFIHPAGMYLGGEVLLVDEINVDPVIETDIETRLSYYAQLNLTSQISEGDTNNADVNAPVFRTEGGRGFVYWWGEHLSTVDSDFGPNIFPGINGLPDSNNKQYVEINNNVGLFDIITAIDPAIDLPGTADEGTEQFKVFIGDEEGRVYDEETVTILNRTPQWGIQGGPTLFDINEGQTLVVSLYGDYVENYGNTTLYWHIDSVNAGTSPNLWDSDFVDFYAPEDSAYGSARGYPDSAGNAVPFQASYFPWNVGGPHESFASFNIATRIDGYFSEATEPVALRVLNKLKVPVATATFNIINQVPTLNVVANDVVEGDVFSFDVTVTAEDVGKTFGWEITGLAASRILTANRTGSVTFSSTTETVNVPTFSTTTYESPTAGTVTVTNPEIGYSNNDGFVMTDLPATYQLTASPAVGEPGNAINFVVSGTNIPDGTDVYFYASGAVPFVGAADADPTTDFSPALPISSGAREPITITSNSGSLSNPGQNPNTTYDGGITVVADADASDEYYEAYIYDLSTGGTELAEFQGTIVVSTNSVTFTGEKDTAGASYTAPLDEFVEEGTYQQFTFSTSNFTTGQTFYYWIESVFGSGGTTVTSADFVSGWATSASRGTFTVDALGEGFIETQLTNDLTAEGDHRFKVLVSNTNTGSAIAELATPIRIEDTSQQEYSIVTSASATGSPTKTTFTEDDNLYVKVTMTSAGPSETLYCELTGTGASQYTTTQETATISTSGSVTFSFTSSGDNGVADADRIITIKVSRNNYASSGGEIVQTAADVDLNINRTLTDPGAVYTLVAGDTTPNEGDTVVFTIGGSSISNGTYYYRPSDWVTTSCSSTITSGTFIPLSFTTGIQLGWKAELNGFSGSVTNVASNGVTLSSAPGAVVSGTIITFAPADDWDFFNLSTNPPRGPVTVTSNAGTFSVNTIEDPGISNLAINFGLYSGQTDVNAPLVEELITIQNITSGDPVGLNNVPSPAQDGFGNLSPYDTRASSISSPITATSYVRFNTDGTISISGKGRPGLDNTAPYDPNQYDISGGFGDGGDYDYYFGTNAAGPVPGDGNPPRYKFGGNWIQNAPISNGSNYRVRVTNATLSGTTTTSAGTISSTTNLTTSGSTGTWLTMSSARTWSLAATTSADGQTKTGFWTLVFEIEETGTTNNVTNQTVILVATATDNVAGDVSPGEFACFLPGTQILLEDGTTKNIEDMQVGERVLGKDGVINEVIKLREDAEANRRIFNVNEGLLKMTGGHLLLTTEGWAAADARIAIALHPELKDEIIQLEPFQELVLADNTTVPITSLTYEWMRTRVYNLNVTDGDDTYVANGIIGQPGVVVHNK